MDLSLAIAAACDDDGCDIEPLDGGARRATWSDAVRNTIKVRRGDLVAVDGSRVVWRWWGGTVVTADRDTATVERNVTQREPGAPRTGHIDVEVPDELDLDPGMRVWFGADGDRKVVVAAGSPEAAVTRLPAVLQALS